MGLGGGFFCVLEFKCYGVVWFCDSATAHVQVFVNRSVNLFYQHVSIRMTMQVCGYIRWLSSIRWTYMCKKTSSFLAPWCLDCLQLLNLHVPWIVVTCKNAEAFIRSSEIASNFPFFFFFWKVIRTWNHENSFNEYLKWAKTCVIGIKACFIYQACQIAYDVVLPLSFHKGVPRKEKNQI